ncbi:hypothetical protein GCM10008967_35300 [Bacillus carboniphilus]|uniref:Uncharacterized protein n=1 Tax=Bacillus carboniphilus TaxID=86663 RepID=A0ABN0WME8_9BACI
MVNQGGPSGFNFYPFLFTDVDSDTDVKLNEDRYEVFVNGNFVGYKTLTNEGDQLSDIDDFLREQGHEGFTSSLDGDHYIIQTEQKEEDLSRALSVYFHNR